MVSRLHDFRAWLVAALLLGSGCRSDGRDAQAPTHALVEIEIAGLPRDAQVTSVQIAGRIGCPPYVIFPRGGHISRGESGEVSCPLGSACQVVVQGDDTDRAFLVPATRWRIDVELEPTRARVRADDGGIAEGLAKVLELEQQLSTACAKHDHAAISTAEAGLARLTSRGAAELRAAAALAHEQCRCSGHELPADAIMPLLDELQTTSIATFLWPQGYGEIVARSVPPGELSSRVARWVEQDRADLAAHALVAVANGKGDRAGDARRQLEQAPWKDHYVVHHERRMTRIEFPRDREIEIDRWSLRLRDGSIAPFSAGDAPTLVYVSAGYCGACSKAAPRLRALAKAHPHVRIVYLVWDAAFEELGPEHFPIPGTLAAPTDTTRDGWRATFGEPLLPGFVAILDGNVAVAHSSNSSLSEAFDLLAPSR
jgi:thiol-disulfide isomerase/thioredoxin